MKIALIGDYDEAVPAHQAIPLAIKLSGVEGVSFKWIHSTEVDPAQLSNFGGIWAVPASPYLNMENILSGIQFARENDIPFLGTCGGYQHAALEYARNALGFSEADNAEVNPEAKMLLIAGLSCKLYDVKNEIKLTIGSFIHAVYDADRISEEYFCGYGVNANYLSIFENGGLKFSGFDDDGDPRILELPANRFFIGTAFQPERSAFQGQPHPLVSRFVNAVAKT